MNSGPSLDRPSPSHRLRDAGSSCSFRNQIHLKYLLLLDYEVIEDIGIRLNIPLVIPTRIMHNPPIERGTRGGDRNNPEDPR